MNIYTGIGSRNITPHERQLIYQIAEKLLEYDYVCLSGNAEGSDNAFQVGSKHNCVLMLPWDGFNEHVYPHTKALDAYVVGKEEKGVEAMMELHPHNDTLKDSAKALHARNYYQIMGFDKYPKSEFVICCADRDYNGDIKGGTGQAERIAKKYKVPIINIRDKNWEEEFEQLIFNIDMFNDF